MSSSPSRLVVGLGNPGPKYEGTRHNVGFRAIDAVANALHVSFERAQHALVGVGEHKNRSIAVAKPLTYMNRSGEAVVALCDHFALSPSALIVIVDDIHLPVGTIRLRPKGSSGGHNGLQHVAERLGTTSFPRLRIGVGSDFADGEQVDYVLSPFTPEQTRDVETAIDDAVEAVLTTVREDFETAMNRFN